MPVEEEPQRPPVLTVAEQQAYTVVEVGRGDMELRRSLSSLYRAALREEIAFKVSNLRVTDQYVALGDYVNVGDVLAELDSGDIKKGLTDAEQSVARLKLERGQIEQNRVLDRKRVDLKKGAEYSAALKLHEDTFKAQFNDIDTRISVEELRLSDLNAQLDKRVIRAGIAGTVLYIKNIPEGETTNEGDTYIIIVDKDTAYFTMKAEDAVGLNRGDRVNVVYKQNEYPADVLSYEDIGIEIPDGERNVYIKTVEPIVDIDEGATAMIPVILDARTNVLFLPVNAVEKIQDGYAVYYEDGDLLAMKSVEVGLEADNLIEITKGVTQGEKVVVKKT